MNLFFQYDKMKKKGFYIKSIIAIGEGMIISKVDFTDGCNLLFGPSDSGKTTLFSIISFLLGSSEDPSNIKESEGYDTFYMEFISYGDGAIHTVCRLRNKNFVEVKDCAFDSFKNASIPLRKFSLDSKSKKPKYSQYLIKLNGFKDNVCLRISNTVKRNMTFSSIRHLMLVSEDNIYKKDSIFLPSNQVIFKTQEKSVIYYLSTGKDDRDFIPNENEKIRRTRIEGMIDLMKENIEEVDDKISVLGDVNFADFNGNKFCQVNKKELDEQKKRLEEMFVTRSSMEDALRKLLSQLLFEEEFIKRMKLLRDHYQIDLSRYDHLYQGASLLEPLNNECICPLCHSHLDRTVTVDDNFLTALRNEYDKVKTKLVDVKKVIVSNEDEYKKISASIEKLKNSIYSIESEITKFKPQLDSLEKILNRYEDNIKKKTYASFLQSESQRLSSKLHDLNTKLKNKPAIQDYKRPIGIGEEFCNMVKEKLINWNVIGNVPVVFDESDFDFKIGGKRRITYGKGTRGVTSAAILMSLIEYCQKKEIPFSNLLVIDSPLTTHFDSDNTPVDETTQNKFFKYCNDGNFNYQLILIDNKAPNLEERNQLKNIHYIEFSENGRKGFYLGKNDKLEAINKLT